jgi:hypothetical protein
LSWVYRKDSSVSSGDDAGWLDAVTFEAGATSLPDLSISQITGPDAGTQGQEVDVAITVKNNGSVTAGAFRIGIFLSPNSTIDLTDLDTEHYCAFDTLAAGESGTCSGAIVIPEGVASGTYYLGAYADSLSAIAEFDESNNGRATANSIVISDTSNPLAVALEGGGGGKVTSNPSGIDCGSDCNAVFAQDSSIELQAAPAAGSVFAGWGHHCAGSGACVLSMDDAKLVQASFVPDDQDEMFPPAARWPSGWLPSASSKAAWHVTSGEASEGAYSLRSAAVSHEEVSGVKITRNFAAGNVSFSLMVSSEADYDFLRFYIDGVLQSQWSGAVAWESVSFPITSGVHRLTWAYEKDVSVSEGSDSAWLDEVKLPDAGDPGVALELNVSGDGSGSVISNPLGLYCGSRCVERFVRGDMVSLYAAPASGSTFLGWSGLCSGANRTCSFTMDDDASVSAQFGLGIDSVLTALIEHYYQNILGRGSDAGGLAHWLSEIKRMQSLGIDLKEAYRVMAGSFLFSPEFKTRNTSNTEYLTILYRTFFDREPDAGGLSFWLSQLDQGLPRNVTLFKFLFSEEYSQYLQDFLGSSLSRGEVDAVVDFYRGYFGRLPDSEGFAFWLEKFRSAQCQGVEQVNQQVESISSAFYSSAEYTDRGRNNGEYVADLYYAFLRRGSELSGYEYWTTELNSLRLQREQMRQAFIGSDEFQGRVSEILSEACIQP